jgi:hypothetical protein
MNFRTDLFLLQRASVVGTDDDQMGWLDKMMKVSKI